MIWGQSRVRGHIRLFYIALTTVWVRDNLAGVTEIKTARAGDRKALVRDDRC